MLFWATENSQNELSSSGCSRGCWCGGCCGWCRSSRIRWFCCSGGGSGGCCCCIRYRCSGCWNWRNTSGTPVIPVMMTVPVTVMMMAFVASHRYFIASLSNNFEAVHCRTDEIINLPQLKLRRKLEQVILQPISCCSRQAQVSQAKCQVWGEKMAF